MHLVNTEPLAVVQHAFIKRLYTDPASRVSIYTQCKAFRQRRGIFETKIWLHVLCLVQLWNVFVLPSNAAHKIQHSVVVLCIIVWKMHVAQLFLCLVFTKYKTCSFLRGSLFTNNDMQWQRREITKTRIVWKNGFEGLVITDADMKL